MTDTNTVDISEDLNVFSDTFFGNEEVDTVEDADADAVATEEDTDAPAETGDEDAPDEEAETETEDESDEDEDEVEEKPKGKNRKSAQERINEITKRAREAERSAAALLQRLEALETRERNSNQEPTKEQLPQGAPAPDAVNDKGEPLYPLGEFDPNFITDLVKFNNEQAKVEFRQELAAQAEAQRLAAAQAELQTTWATRLDAVEEEIPEIREHIAELTDVFAGLDPKYGEYLATTVMQCENGPLIMEYLSQNIGEAQEIVASGPMAATLSIGKLENMLSKPKEEKSNKKVSAAPSPPAQVNKGRKGNVPVREDTDDLDAFSGLFYSQK